MTTHYKTGIVSQPSYPSAQGTGAYSSPYDVYNKTSQPYGTTAQVTGVQTPGAELGVYDSSTPQSLQTQGANVAMTATSQPLGSMGIPPEEGSYVVELPPTELSADTGDEETIRIRLGPHEGWNDEESSSLVSVKPVVEEGKEKIKISFIGNETSTHEQGANEITLEPPSKSEGKETIRISFGKKEPTGVSLSKRPHGKDHVKSIKISFAQPTKNVNNWVPTPAPAQVSEDHGTEDENITINFLNNVKIEGLSQSELQKAVTVQKQRE